jgi:hypothetical protein
VNLSVSLKFTLWLLFVVLMVYVIVLATTGIGAIRKSDQFLGAVTQSDESGFSGALDNAKLELLAIDEAVRETRSLLAPALSACVVVKWIPIVGDSCNRVDILFDRYEQDFVAVETTLESLSGLTGLVAIIGAEGLGVTENELTQKIDQVKSSLGNAKASLAISRSFREEQPNGGFGVLNLASEKLDSSEKQLAELITFSENVTDALQGAISVVGLADETIDLVRGADGDSFTALSDSWGEMSGSLTELSSAISLARNSVPDYVVETDIGRELEVVFDDVDRLLSALDAVGYVFSSVAEVLNGQSDESGSIVEDGRLGILLSNLTGNREVLEASLQSIEDLSSGSSSDRVSVGASLGLELKGMIESQIGSLDLLINAPGLMAGFLGIPNARRILVLGQSSDELRAQGGFTSSAWIINTDAGALDEMEYLPIDEFGELEMFSSFQLQPEELALYMDTGGWYMRDVGWSPHFPSVARTAISMASNAGHEKIDAVLSITQGGIVDLVGAIGSIDVDGTAVTKDSLIAVLEQGTDESGTGYLRDLFSAFVESLTGDVISENFLELSQAVLGSFETKKMMIYSNDPADQSSIQDLGWSGSYTVGQVDSLAIVDSNVGWNKVDRNIDRSGTYRAVVGDDGSVDVRLNLTYSNVSEITEDGCDRHAPPTRVNNFYKFLLDGCYWNFVRIYTPFGANEVSLAELPLPNSATPVKSGALSAGASSSGISFDDDGQYFGGLITVESQTDSTSVFDYRLNPGTVETGGDTIEYSLQFWAQSGILERPMNIEIRLPDSFEVTFASPEPSVISDNVVVFTGSGTSDVLFEVSGVKR